jgi:ABC-type multidrug transport system fused ATPase/permease subunit
LNKNKTSLWQKFTFSDVTPLMKDLGERAAEKKDLNSIPFVNSTLKQEDSYPEFLKAITSLRKSPFRSLIKFEKKQFISMFFIHVTDVVASLISALAAIQLLRSFESTSNNFRLISLLYQDPTRNETMIFTIGLASIIFMLNILAASLHAQKIEKEMLLSWRIPFKLMKYIYTHLLFISKKDRTLFQTGDITNLAQNDSRFLGNYLAHAMVDLPVLIASCALVMAIMIATIGNAAWLGFAMICLQIPISLFFTWLGNRLHREMMKRGDKRLQLVSEWVQGMRLIRYFGWGNHFKREINQATLSEYKQDLKITVKYCIAFAITHNWWMVVSSAIFAGIVYFNGNKEASTIFAAIWLSGILGQQITPLPWFVNAWSQAIVASKRLKNFYRARIQSEEFSPNNINMIDNETELLIHRIINKDGDFKISISFSLKNVYLRFSKDEPYVIHNVSLDIPAQQTLAIVGPVASGKSLLIQIIMGDLVPTSGEVLFKIKVSEKNKNDIYIKGNVHTEIGISLLRTMQSYVPQEAFIMSSSIRENIPLKYKYGNNEYANDSDIINSLYAASFATDLKTMDNGLETEIGERGVNLSGGQKQRVSLSRSAFANASLILLDDPLSAVDVNTEKELVQNIFIGKWGKNKTIIWATHRLEFLNFANTIIFIENGKILEKGNFQVLIQNQNSRLNQFLLGLKNNERR